MIKALLYETGKRLKRDFYELNSSNAKEKFELVTASDINVEDFLIDNLKAKYPDCSIFSEERGEIGNRSDKKWIIDPIDGTADFVFGVPYFSISLSLQINGEITEGHVYNPISNEYYFSSAETGQAFLNGEIIKVSSTCVVEESLIAFGFSANYPYISDYYKRWGHLFDNCKKGMPLISPALTLCNIARGRIDAYLDSRCSMEGQAAGALILQNAGGKLLNYDLSKYNHRAAGIIATNGNLSVLL